VKNILFCLFNFFLICHYSFVNILSPYIILEVSYSKGTFTAQLYKERKFQESVLFYFLLVSLIFTAVTASQLF